MGIINIKLDKEKYYYGIDKNIVVSFEMSSQDNIEEKDIKAYYGYYVYGQSALSNKHKYLGFKDSTKEINKEFGTNKYSFEVPIIIFNLGREELNGKIGIQNFINIEYFQDKKNEKIYPKIVFDEYSIHSKKEIRYFHLRYKDIPSEFQYELSEEEVSKAINAVNFFSDKNKNPDNTIKLETEFKGLISTFWIKLKSNNLLSDYISHYFYDHLNSKLSLNIFFKLINSKIYNLIYKYSIFPPIIIWLDLLLSNRIYNLVGGILPYKVFIIFGLSFLAIFIFSKLYEMYAKQVIMKLAYNIKLLKSEKIEESLSNKLLYGTLQISDIFDSFKINDKFLGGKYLFSVSLNCYIKSYYHDRNSKTEDVEHIFSLDLFSESNKKNFSINSMALLHNNYMNLEGILPRGQKVEGYGKSNGVEIYYGLTYQLDSIGLPNILESISLQPKFN